MRTKQPKAPKVQRIGRVRAALLDWLGVPISLTTGEFWSEWLQASTATGETVTVDKALQLSTVWACVRLLADTVSALPLHVYRRQADGGRAPARAHPLAALLRRPSPDMTPMRFWKFVVASMVVRGNAFVEIKRAASGRMVALIPLLPQSVVVRRDKETGTLEYEVAEEGGRRKIPAANVMHIREFSLDGVMGLQPVATGAEVIGAAQAAERSAGKFYRGGMQPSGVLTVENGFLKDQQREALRAQMAKFQSSDNAAKLVVLEAGMKYQAITMNPEVAQMLQTRAFNVEEICRWFRIPPFMVGHMDKASSWASSVEGQNMHFLTNTLRPILENIEQEIARCLIGQAEQDTVYAEFSVEGLLRADSAGRAAYYSTALQNGWMSRNEVRRRENESPIPGGDTYTVQSNLLPLDQLGKGRTDADAARAALRAWLGEIDQTRRATTTEATT